MDNREKWEIVFNNLTLVWFALFAIYTFIGVNKGMIGFCVLGVIFAGLFVFNYKPIKEKQ
jgi:hypothetical protein